MKQKPLCWKLRKTGGKPEWLIIFSSLDYLIYLSQKFKNVQAAPNMLARPLFFGN